MAKLPRIKQEIFGSEAGPQDIGVVGSLHEGNPTYALTTEQIQSLEAFKRGLRSVVIGENSPILEEDNGMYKLITQQLAYLLQRGIPEWNEDTVYYRGSWVTGPNAILYFCLFDNTTSPPSDTNDWISFNISPFQWPDNYIPESKLIRDSLPFVNIDNSAVSSVGILPKDIPGAELTLNEKTKRISIKLNQDSLSVPGKIAMLSTSFNKTDVGPIGLYLVFCVNRKVGASSWEIINEVLVPVVTYFQEGKTGMYTIDTSPNIEVADLSIFNDEVKYKLSVRTVFDTSGYADSISINMTGSVFRVSYF